MRGNVLLYPLSVVVYELLRHLDDVFGGAVVDAEFTRLVVLSQVNVRLDNEVWRGAALLVNGLIIIPNDRDFCFIEFGDCFQQGQVQRIDVLKFIHQDMVILGGSGYASV